MLVFSCCHLTVNTSYCNCTNYISGILKTASIETSENWARRHKAIDLEMNLFFSMDLEMLHQKKKTKILRHTSERHKFQREGEDPAMVR